MVWFRLFAFLMSFQGAWAVQMPYANRRADFTHDKKSFFELNQNGVSATLYDGDWEKPDQAVLTTLGTSDFHLIYKPDSGYEVIASKNSRLVKMAVVFPKLNQQPHLAGIYADLRSPESVVHFDSKSLSAVQDFAFKVVEFRIQPGKASPQFIKIFISDLGDVIPMEVSRVPMKTLRSLDARPRSDSRFESEFFEVNRQHAGQIGIRLKNAPDVEIEFIDGKLKMNYRGQASSPGELFKKIGKINGLSWDQVYLPNQEVIDYQRSLRTAAARNMPMGTFGVPKLVENPVPESIAKTTVLEKLEVLSGRGDLPHPDRYLSIRNHVRDYYRLASFHQHEPFFTMPTMDYTPEMEKTFREMVSEHLKGFPDRQFPIKDAEVFFLNTKDLSAENKMELRRDFEKILKSKRPIYLGVTDGKEFRVHSFLPHSPLKLESLIRPTLHSVCNSSVRELLRSVLAHPGN